MTEPMLAVPHAPSRRPTLAPLTLHLAVVAFILAAHNFSFWGHVVTLFGSRPGLMVLLAGAFAALLLLMSWLPAPGPLRKPWLVILLMAGAASSYYRDRLGVIVDRDMIQNIFLTTPTEARHLITPSLAGHLLLWGVLPSAAVLCLRLSRRRLWGGSGAGGRWLRPVWW